MESRSPLCNQIQRSRLDSPYAGDSGTIAEKGPTIISSSLDDVNLRVLTGVDLQFSNESSGILKCILLGLITAASRSQI
jgi:hypothetical protein